MRSNRWQHASGHVGGRLFTVDADKTRYQVKEVKIGVAEHKAGKE